MAHRSAIVGGIVGASAVAANVVAILLFGGSAVGAWWVQNWIELLGVLASLATAAFLFPAFLETIRKPKPEVQFMRLDNEQTIVVCVRAHDGAPLRRFDSVYVRVGPWPIEIIHEATFEDGLSVNQLQEKYAMAIELPAMSKELALSPDLATTDRAKVDRGLYFAWDDADWGKALREPLAVKVRVYYGDHESRHSFKFGRRRRPVTLMMSRAVEHTHGFRVMHVVPAKRPLADPSPEH